jgi:hypothetical protein
MNLHKTNQILVTRSSQLPPDHQVWLWGEGEEQAKSQVEPLLYQTGAPLLNAKSLTRSGPLHSTPCRMPHSAAWPVASFMKPFVAFTIISGTVHQSNEQCSAVQCSANPLCSKTSMSCAMPGSGLLGRVAGEPAGPKVHSSALCTALH